VGSRYRIGFVNRYDAVTGQCGVAEDVSMVKYICVVARSHLYLYAMISADPGEDSLVDVLYDGQETPDDPDTPAGPTNGHNGAHDGDPDTSWHAPLTRLGYVLVRAHPRTPSGRGDANGCSDSRLEASRRLTGR
jgi:hypothetical protein